MVASGYSGNASRAASALAGGDGEPAPVGSGDRDDDPRSRPPAPLRCREGRRQGPARKNVSAVSS